MSTTSKLCAALSLSAVIGAMVVATTTTASALPASANVVFEVTGPGSVFTIDIDPGGQRIFDAQLPFQKSATVGPDVQLLQVVAVGKDTPTPGCRITVDGQVVAEKAPGGDSHCIFDRGQTTAQGTGTSPSAGGVAPAAETHEGPTVNWRPIAGGLQAKITDRSGVTSQCEYASSTPGRPPYDRSFALKANSTFNLDIIPAIPAFQNWDVTITCDNGTKTETSTFF